MALLFLSVFRTMGASRALVTVRKTNGDTVYTNDLTVTHRMVDALSASHAVDASLSRLPTDVSDKLPLIGTALAVQDLIAESLCIPCHSLADAIRLARPVMSTATYNKLCKFNQMSGVLKHNASGIDSKFLASLRNELTMEPCELVGCSQHARWRST